LAAGGLDDRDAAHAPRPIAINQLANSDKDDLAAPLLRDESRPGAEGDDRPGSPSCTPRSSNRNFTLTFQRSSILATRQIHHVEALARFRRRLIAR